VRFAERRPCTGQRAIEEGNGELGDRHEQQRERPEAEPIAPLDDAAEQGAHRMTPIVPRRERQGNQPRREDADEEDRTTHGEPRWNSG
jgi:hypothetical protein